MNKWTVLKLNLKFEKENRSIRILPTDAPYLPINKKYKFICNSCDSEFESLLSNILRSKNFFGCPKCIRRLSDKKIDDNLYNRNILRLDKCIKSSVPIKFKCLKGDCLHIWKTTPNSILSARSGCPKCAGLVKLDNNTIDSKLKNRLIQRLDDYINIDTPINFVCLLNGCNNIWKASPANIVHKNKGCPLHFRKNEAICLKAIRSEFEILFHNYRLYLFNSGISKYHSVDIFLPLINKKYAGIALEYHGRQHYEPVTWGKIEKDKAEYNLKKQIESDKIKKNFCNNNNILYIVIDGRKYSNKKLEDYLINILIPKINQIIFD